MTIPAEIVVAVIWAAAALVLGWCWRDVQLARLGLVQSMGSRLQVAVKMAEGAGDGVAEAVSCQWVTPAAAADDDDADDEGPAVADRAIGF